jgi:hypothetical protein
VAMTAPYLYEFYFNIALLSTFIFSKLYYRAQKVMQHIFFSHSQLILLKLQICHIIT